MVNNNKVVLSGVGIWHPDYKISNAELMQSYNAYAEKYNAENSENITAENLMAKPLSTAEFVEKASGIKSRYVYRKEGILDIDRMRPKIEERGNDEVSHQAEMAVNAARIAMQSANKNPEDIDAVIVSCSYTQRSYPAIAIEVQEQLGIEGFGFDMLVACSAATFALQRAYEMVLAKTARCVLIINPELMSPQINWRDRNSHFIFGDIATASIIEQGESCDASHAYEIISTKSMTSFSSNIRSNFGHLIYGDDSDLFNEDKFFAQNGRKVFKEVCPLAAEHISSHLESNNIESKSVSRFWLHQANINMNNLIAKRVLGRAATEKEAPIVLGEYANTASAGSIIAFCLHHEDLNTGDIGLLCSFGAGYSIGSLILRKV